jgi:O-antigen/teichoic acid export membrane protein
VSLALLIATIALVSAALPLRPRFDLGEWRALARDTLVFAAAGSAYIAYFRVTIVVMSLVASATQTGYFATSFRIMEALTPIPLVLIGAAFPIFVRAARDDRARLRHATQRVFDVALIGGAWASMAVVLGAGFAIDVIGGPEFEPSVAVLRIQGVALVATFIAFATSYPLIALRRHRELLLANLVPLAASLPLSLVLVSLFEARGGAVATLAAELMLAGGMVFFAVRSELALNIPWKTVAWVVAATALACAAALALPIGDLPRVGVASVIYFGVLAAFRQLPLEAAAAIGEALRGRGERGGEGAAEA